MKIYPDTQRTGICCQCQSPVEFHFSDDNTWCGCTGATIRDLTEQAVEALTPIDDAELPVWPIRRTRSHA
jgi:hypothetical protein